jgi:hypothetical protein
MVWKGYRDYDDTTRAREPVEGDVWEAGAESDVLLLGVSFSTGDRIVMNTIHIAHPGSPDTTAIADGLLILTYPTRPRK